MQTTFQSKMNRYIKKGMAFAMAATTLVTTLTSNVSDTTLIVTGISILRKSHAGYSNRAKKYNFCSPV